MMATSLGTTTGLTRTAGLNTRGVAAALWIGLAIIGGEGDGGATGTGASMRALNSDRSGRACTYNNGTTIKPVNKRASLRHAAAIGNGRALPVGTRLYSNIGHFLPECDQIGGAAETA